MIVFALGVPTDENVRNNDVRIEVVYGIRPGYSPTDAGFIQLIQIRSLPASVPDPHASPGRGIAAQTPILPLYSRDSDTGHLLFLGFGLGESDVLIEAVLPVTSADDSQYWVINSAPPAYISSPIVPDDTQNGEYTNDPLLTQLQLLTLVGTDQFSSFIIWMGRPASYTWNQPSQPTNTYSQQGIYVMVLKLTLSLTNLEFSFSVIFDQNSDNIFVGQGLLDFPQISTWADSTSGVQITYDFPAAFALPSSPLAVTSAITQYMPIAIEDSVLQYQVVTTIPADGAAAEPEDSLGVSALVLGSTAQFDDPSLTGISDPCSVCSLMRTTNNISIKMPRKVKPQISNL